MPFIVPLNGSPAVLSGIDAGNEAWNFSVFGKVLTAVNFVAQEALWATLVDDVMAVVLGAKKTTYYGNEVHFAYDQPTNGAAREIALRLQAKDATTQERFTYRIPTIDPTIPVYIENINARDVVDPTTPSSIVDLVTAFNAFAVSPVTGNALVAIGIAVVRGFK